MLLLWLLIWQNQKWHIFFKLLWKQKFLHINKAMNKKYRLFFLYDLPTLTIIRANCSEYSLLRSTIKVRFAKPKIVFGDSNKFGKLQSLLAGFLVSKDFKFMTPSLEGMSRNGHCTRMNSVWVARMEPSWLCVISKRSPQPPGPASVSLL